MHESLYTYFHSVKDDAYWLRGQSVIGQGHSALKKGNFLYHNLLSLSATVTFLKIYTWDLTKWKMIITAFFGQMVSGQSLVEV